MVSDPVLNKSPNPASPYRLPLHLAPTLLTPPLSLAASSVENIPWLSLFLAHSFPNPTRYNYHCLLTPLPTQPLSFLLTQFHFLHNAYHFLKLVIDLFTCLLTYHLRHPCMRHVSFWRREESVLVTASSSRPWIQCHKRLSRVHIKQPTPHIVSSSCPLSDFRVRNSNPWE